MRLSLLLIALSASTPALAVDTVTTPFPGVSYTHRSQASPRKEIHIVTVDLTRPEVAIRATRSSERGRTPSSFSNLVDAAVVVNGDFFNTDGSYDPSGLAIGAGNPWADGVDSNGSRFIACTADKVCTIDTTATTVAADEAWQSAVGGRRLLIKPGWIFTTEMDTSCGDHCTTQHPRTAVGLKDGGETLVLVVVEGRQDPVFGLKISQLATLMQSLGCEQALELDGGGSSTMVVAGARVSGRPDNEPSERAVANHLAVLFDESAATTGRLLGFVREGDIYDETAPIAGASVSLSSGQSTTTDADGFYSFDEVEQGSVVVTVSREGFQTASDTKDVVAGVDNWKSIALARADDPPGEGEGEGEGEPVGEGEGEGEGDGEGEGEPAGEGEGEGEGEAGGEGEGEAADGNGDDAGGAEEPRPQACGAGAAPLACALSALLACRRRRA